MYIQPCWFLNHHTSGFVFHDAASEEASSSSSTMHHLASVHTPACTMMYHCLLLLCKLVHVDMVVLRDEALFCGECLAHLLGDAHHPTVTNAVQEPQRPIAALDSRFDRIVNL